MRIGDYYNNGLFQGVVIRVDASGDHGLILSLRAARKKWFCGDVDMNTGARNQLRGQDNQDLITKRFSIHMFPAFEWCLGLGDGWYLPAIGELECLCEKSNFDAVALTLDKYGDKLISGEHWAGDLYLSSTEGDTGPHSQDHTMVLVLAVSERGARITSDTKRSSFERVRAVHRF